jgi:nifR3 family TIM-barrel protein
MGQSLRVSVDSIWPSDARPSCGAGSNGRGYQCTFSHALPSIRCRFIRLGNGDGSCRCGAEQKNRANDFVCPRRITSQHPVIRNRTTLARRSGTTVVSEGLVDHIDMNFGCPAPKVTRNGGGAAVPLKRNLFRSIVRAAVVGAQEESGGRVPVTIKFRKGLNEDLLTFLDAGRIGEDEGVAGVSLHARTAEQLYSGKADWKAIGELKEAVTSIPVLGNGDIWEASDALAMMHETGCDGVVVGRGCLGKPWLFRDLADAFAGRVIQDPPVMAEVMSMMREHAQLLWDYFELDRGIRDFRKHAGWYVTGYSVGPDMRRRLGQVSSLMELDDLLGEIDPTLTLPEANRRIPRGHTNGPRPVHLPHGYLDNLDDATPPTVEEEAMANGG